MVNLKKRTIDLKKLDAGLNKLTGYDLEAIEKEERMTGNNSVELTLSKSFQARLAAKVLDMNVHDLKGLPLREYNQICAATFAFLFATSDAEGPPTK